VDASYQDADIVVASNSVALFWPKVAVREVLLACVADGAPVAALITVRGESFAEVKYIVCYLLPSYTRHLRDD
jgi:hypothetical protein